MAHVSDTFRTQRDDSTLTTLCHNLLSEQVQTWVDLKKAYAALRHVRTRGIRCNGFSVLLQYNPGRIISSLAGMDRTKDIEHACFLCPQNLPKDQQGILYHDTFLILCNPAPVLPFHFTVSHVNHCRQEIMPYIGTFLSLTADLGSQWLVLYNGPHCGASAPHHLHFQVIPSGKTPVEKEIQEKSRLRVIKKHKGVHLYEARAMGRECRVLEGNDSIAITHALNDYMAALKKDPLTTDEPMINIAGFFDSKNWHLILLPRRKHRPHGFYQKGGGRVVVSPAILEMLGLIITPLKKDFEKLDASAIEKIFEEVSLKNDSPIDGATKPKERTS